VDVRRSLSPVSGEIARLALLALAAAACSGSLHPIRAGVGTDAAGVTDGATHTDATTAPDVPNVVCFDLPPIGYATMSDIGGEWDGGTTGMPTLQLDGGVSFVAAAPPPAGSVVVDASDPNALMQFSMYAGDKTPGPLTILVKGMIFIPPPPDGGSADLQKIRVSSNKTILGVNVLADSKQGSGSGFTGGSLTMTGVSHVVLRNLVIAMPNADDASDNVDAIHIEGSQQIWVDHCDLSSNGPTGGGSSYDGLVDISDQSDFVTVSWTHYHDHADTGLIGRSDSSAAAAQDASKNHVTYDHDWFSNVLTGPRVRFGTVHVLDTFFDGVGHYGVASTDGANVRVEESVFKDVAPPPQTNANFGPVTTILDSPATAGSVYLVDYTPTGTSGANVITQTVPFNVPYANQYKPDPATSVPAVVQGCAGTGHISVSTN
jgi:pectate lyase